MPRLNTIDMENHQLPTGSYGYSAVGLEKLGASEYTLAVIVCDVSGSVSGFKHEMERAIQEVVKSCRYSPRSHNLMLRLVTFSDDLEETHGYKLLEDCKPEDYDDILTIRNVTALYDAAENAIAAAVDYGKRLTAEDYLVNAAVYVITDGCDNHSTLGPHQVAAVLSRAKQEEALESIVSILIGVNIQDHRVKDTLDAFHRDAGFSQFVSLPDATAKTLAKLAAFVSKSISSQSQALGSGGPSQPLKF